MDACIQLLKGGTGGKLLVFASVLPKVSGTVLKPAGHAARQGPSFPVNLPGPVRKAGECSCPLQMHGWVAQMCGKSSTDPKGMQWEYPHPLEDRFDSSER